LKKFSPILILLMASLAFSSCEKVIEVNLDDSASVIVIEATITNNKEPFSVLVSKTTPYFGTTTSTLVSGATVSVRAENGEPKYFNESSPGVYNLEKTIAQPNYWYIVDVEYEGITYSARSYLNEFVPITDFSISHFDGLGFVESGYKICCFIKDPPGIDNYYRMKILVNGKTVTDDGEFNLYSDELFDGKEVGLVQQSAVFQETDTITIELQSIDEATYNYFNTLETISGIEILQSASPSNPTSNFDNDALGYFSAYSFDRKTLVVSEFIGK
jgi:hypothetical protein